jgi:hypothetical protein
MSLNRMRSNGNKRVHPFPKTPSRDRTTIKPYRVWLRSFPKHPYRALIWSTSRACAIKLFIAYLTENNFRLQRTSPGCYDTAELTREFALLQKDPIRIGENHVPKNS